MSILVDKLQFARTLLPELRRAMKRHCILMDMMYRGDSIKDYGYDD